MRFKEFLKENAGEFLTDRNEIEAWLGKMEIKNYTIHDDCVVDVDGTVNITGKELTHIPVQFGKVASDFACDDNKLVALDGCPTHVGGYFSCANNKLTSLVGSPAHVGAGFLCEYNQLASLKGAPRAVGNDFYCNNNNLTSLAGAPETVGGIFNCSRNKLMTLEGCPVHLGRIFYCRGNQITSHTICLILTGCTKFDVEGGWATIIKKYLGRPEDIFECQAELIEHGFDEHAQL